LSARCAAGARCRPLLWFAVLCFAGATPATDSGPSRIDLQRSARVAYFAGFDRNGDGRVTAAEYVDYLRIGFDLIDRDGNGLIDDSELPAGARRSTSRERRGHELAVRQTFRRLDIDGNGWLSVEELTAPPR
jgi:hypothetical protein